MGMGVSGLGVIVVVGYPLTLIILKVKGLPFTLHNVIFVSWLVAQTPAHSAEAQGRPSGEAFVTFASEEYAQHALQSKQKGAHAWNIPGPARCKYMENYVHCLIVGASNAALSIFQCRSLRTVCKVHLEGCAATATAVIHGVDLSSEVRSCPGGFPTIKITIMGGITRQGRMRSTSHIKASSYTLADTNHEKHRYTYTKNLGWAVRSLCRSAATKYAFPAGLNHLY